MCWIGPHQLIETALGVFISHVDVHLDRDFTFPAPTLGLYGELPIGDIVLEADISGVYIDAGDSFEGWALRAGANAVWRPWDHVGVFGGFNWIYVDLDLNNEDIQASLYGPMAGVELRF